MALEFTNIRNPRYVTADGKAITCEVTCDGKEIIFCAREDDEMDYGRELYARIKQEFKPEDIKKYTPAYPKHIKMVQLRKQLAKLGFLEQVNTAMATADEGVKLDWDFETKVSMDSQLMAAIAGQLNFNHELLVQFFIDAARIGG